MKVTLLILASFMLFALFACNNGPKEAENEKGISRKEPPERTKNIIKKETRKIPSEYLIADSQAGKFKIGDDIPFHQNSEPYQIRKEQQVRYTEEGPIEEMIYIISGDSNNMLTLKPQYDHNQGAVTTQLPKTVIPDAA